MTFQQTFGSRAQVMHGTAKKTSGGLTKSQLTYNKQGRIVSKKASALAKKNNRLVKAGFVTTKGVFGTKMKGGGLFRSNRDPSSLRYNLPVSIIGTPTPILLGKVKYFLNIDNRKRDDWKTANDCYINIEKNGDSIFKVSLLSTNTDKYKHITFINCNIVQKKKKGDDIQHRFYLDTDVRGDIIPKYLKIKLLDGKDVLSEHFSAQLFTIIGTPTPILLGKVKYSNKVDKMMQDIWNPAYNCYIEITQTQGRLFWIELSQMTKSGKLESITNIDCNTVQKKKDEYSFFLESNATDDLNSNYLKIKLLGGRNDVLREHFSAPLLPIIVTSNPMELGNVEYSNKVDKMMQDIWNPAYNCYIEITQKDRRLFWIELSQMTESGKLESITNIDCNTVQKKKDEYSFFLESNAKDDLNSNYLKIKLLGGRNDVLRKHFTIQTSNEGIKEVTRIYNPEEVERWREQESIKAKMREDAYEQQEQNRREELRINEAR